MVLTYRSSQPEERVIIERSANGDKRVARAVQSAHNPKMWNLSLEHPSGMRWRGDFHGDGATVNVALAQLLVDKESDYQQERARGHKPESMLRDPNVRVDAFGEDIAAPIKAWS